MAPYLTAEELAFICEGLTRPSSQVRHLRELGLKVATRPNGKPLVARSNWEDVMGRMQAPAPAAEATKPDETALILHFQRKGPQNGRHGQKTKQPA